ncbi:AlpA family phage regulatory protein [Mesosutterella sp. OilRF-GAM-744-9]|uniref:AlpA family phage regulatory protein n=1 Tax=Mesosutterella porci TaxID=2915351 RepID=A0ABS9MU13_9BURK|nr:AlpA family phage regulatory protein [Mesosutterella sp. oilRF-744-WT-GAM-9]MCG5031834.1 AlpA family phage regulatory protein [Mesosutterella sp. oilRF-744-WT-GAM-9]
MQMILRSRGKERTVNVPDDWNKGRTCLNVYQVAALLGLAPSTIWRKVKTESAFPRPCRISAHTTAWYSDELDEYLNAAPADFGKGERFRDCVLEAMRNPRYRRELIEFLVSSGLINETNINKALNIS